MALGDHPLLDPLSPNRFQRCSRSASPSDRWVSQFYSNDSSHCVELDNVAQEELTSHHPHTDNLAPAPTYATLLPHVAHVASLSSQEQVNPFLPVTADTRHCPSISPVFTMNLTPIDPITHMMEALMQSIKSIIAAHVAMLAQTSVLEHVPHHNNANAPIAQTFALEHGAQNKLAIQIRGGAPSDSSRNHTPIPSTFPEEEVEWNTARHQNRAE